MPETHREYSTYQVALQGFNRPRMPAANLQEADIVLVRRDEWNLGVGLKEMHTFLWVPIMCGYDNDFIDLFELPWTDTNDDNATIVYEKRRFAIPFEKLQERHVLSATLDLDKIRDQTIIYQPFYNVDETNGLFVTKVAPLPAEGLVWDKHRTQWV